MESSDLRIFEAVALAGGITKAASVLNTVQSNVTARLRLLERELGTPLFYRHSRGVTLTRAGRELLPYASRIGVLLAEARRVIDDATPQGRLHFGSLETTAGLRLPPILAAFTAAHPQVDINLQTGTTAELIAAVLAYRLEGALVAGPVDHPDLLEETIFEEELVLVTAPSWPGIDRWTAEAGGRKILVLRAGCSYRQRLERILEERGAVDIRLMEFGTIEGIIGCAAAGIGITLLPRSVLESARHAGRVAIHRLPPEQARVATVFIRRNDTFVSRALARFLECCTTARIGEEGGERMAPESLAAG